MTWRRCPPRSPSKRQLLFPLAGLTAWQALFDHGHLAAGQTALILGAGGGVGTLAVQLAHGAGARVVGAARAWARQLVRGLGADAFIDLEREALDERTAGDADVVFDLVGGDLLRRAWAAVKPGECLSQQSRIHGRAVARGRRCAVSSSSSYPIARR